MTCPLPEVGTVVEPLDETTALVEFSDDGGRAYAIFPCRRVALLVLRTAPFGRMNRIWRLALKIEIDPQTYARADGELLVCEAADKLPMAQRYFLFEGQITESPAAWS